MSNSKTALPQACRVNILESRTVKRVCLKHSWRGKSAMLLQTHENRKCTKIKTPYMSTFNIRTLSFDDILTVLKEELKM